MTFINCSNHTVKFWSQEQKAAAEKYGTIIDLGFPTVDPMAGSEEVNELVRIVVDRICGYEPKAVMCQGEFTLVFGIVEELKKRGITVLAACSERCVEEEHRPDGSVNKKSTFRFVQFREY